MQTTVFSRKITTDRKGIPPDSICREFYCLPLCLLARRQVCGPLAS
jgi:hypothetical protein